MNKHFDNISNSNWLTRQDREDFARYLNIFAKDISPFFGAFNWDDPNFIQFCHQNKLMPKGKKNAKKQMNHFWFNASKPTGHITNDTAHHLLRHIRNAFSHGLIELRYEGRQRRKFYLLKDFDKNNQQSMQGYIRSDLFWEMILLLFQTRNLNGRI